MLFHGVPGGELQKLIKEVYQSTRGNSTTVSSAVDMDDAQMSMESIGSDNVCAGCKEKIADRYYLLAVDKHWHMDCLKCCECKLNLESEVTCFCKDGRIYCKEDYYRRFSLQRCAMCNLGISASEMVMRVRDFVYHLNCFTCTSCNKRLATGDHFAVRDSLVYCQLHLETVMQGRYAYHGDLPLGKGLSMAAGKLLRLSCSNSIGMVQKGRPKNRKSPSPGAGLVAYNAAVSCNENGDYMDGDSRYSSKQKSKRMRTSFKHHQLRTMKSYFAINHNPGVKDLKQLAQKTGLTKRVLQVWFQNARAKFRRNLLHQESTGLDQGLDFANVALPGASPSRPPSELSNASLSPSSTTLTDLISPSIPTVNSILMIVPGNLDRLYEPANWET
ncbi:LIM/homeobox protein Lhx2-like [Centroberyx affinis]|uniref:LIM/homeobox protein Lhx2-like n=1 Tax=Centroberyx affinis TaxID=166261 RepID=UPI003A5C2F82